jgi:TonB family protein
MNPLLIYSIKASVYVAAFYFVFIVLLSKDTRYGRNRAFILLSVLTSLILPLTTIRTAGPVNFPFFGKTLGEVLVTVSGSTAPPKISALDPMQTLFIVYLTGTFFFGSKLLINMAELAFIIFRNKIDGTHIIRLQGLNTIAFSGLGYIFINADLPAEETEAIMKHEQNHLDHLHFFDIVFIETAGILLWFNPFIHMFNRSLRAVHEYQADEECIRTGTPVLSYQKILMNQVFQTKIFSISNSFSNPSFLKKRMIMMTKKRSTTLANLKLLLVLPVIAIVMIAFSSCRDKSKATSPQPDTENKVVVGDQAPPEAPPPPPPPEPYTVTKGDTIWTQVEEMPVFSGGDAALLRYIAENTKYPEAAKKNGIQGRVITRFCVTSEGNVSQVSILKGVDPELDAESVRVISSLPPFKPGKQGGKPVPVWYMVPITFTLN